MVEVLEPNVVDFKLYTKFEINRVVDALRNCLPIELTMDGFGDVDVHEITTSGWVTFSPVLGGALKRVRTSVLADNLVRVNSDLVEYVLDRTA